MAAATRRRSRLPSWKSHWHRSEVRLDVRQQGHEDHVLAAAALDQTAGGDGACVGVENRLQ